MITCPHISCKTCFTLMVYATFFSLRSIVWIVPLYTTSICSFLNFFCGSYFTFYIKNTLYYSKTQREFFWLNIRIDSLFSSREPPPKSFSLILTVDASLHQLRYTSGHQLSPKCANFNSVFAIYYLFALPLTNCRWLH